MTGKPSRSGAAAACAMALAAGVLAACGGSGGGGTASLSTPENGRKAAGTTVIVTMTDYRLALSTRTFTAGDHTIVARNEGHTVHSLEIEGKGSEVRLPRDLRPGQSARLHVTLKDGGYELYCPVGNHKELGMKTEITVRGDATG
ncbi:cupredoxin domain-containing protein [Streptomyces sp. NPDC096132]|uniref:cupredoxin domain-containing protein n=1 Tax=Streptomyces sp. NPDC096132 TaxID=3366075 RepID=UPI003821789D